MKSRHHVAIIVAILLFPVSACFPSQENPTKEELLDTVRHIAALAKQQGADLDAANGALAHAQTVEIPKLKLAISDQATELAAAKVTMAKKDAAIWRNLILGLIAGLILGLLGPKLLPLLASI